MKNTAIVLAIICGIVALGYMFDNRGPSPEPDYFKRVSEQR
jgi:hypothetical protein